MRKHRKPILGVAYIAVIALLLLSSVQTYRKAMPWQGTLEVELTTATPGLELNPLSDVKLQGLRVGEVREVTSNGRAAVIRMAIDEDKADLIPANVDARIVPKTLFGEKYVDLLVPADPTKARISDGDEIKQSTTSVEIGELFTQLASILRALRPEQVSTVLNSMARALDGRGATLGKTAFELERFLGKLGPHLDTLSHDLRQFARTADIYADSAPELVRILGNAASISDELLVPKEQEFGEFLDSVISTANTSTDVLRENTERLVTLSGRARPVLKLLDTYSTVLPCVLDTLHVLDNVATHATGARGAYINLRVDVVTARKPYTYPDDLPSNPNSDANVNNLHRFIPSWDPHCPDLAKSLYSVKPVKPFSQTGTTPVPPAPRSSGAAEAAPPSAALLEAREALARSLAARALGVDAVEVPAYAGLLLAPLITEGEVEVR
jgi:phospholipid/cholesterol/gamma-HCH transport system substrate-binding protein